MTIYGRNLLPSTVGFDRLLSTMEEFERMASSATKTYPPYNILKDGDRYKIEIAISGFKKDEIEILFDNAKLTVTGESKNDIAPENYLHKGIGKRNFTHKFTLADTIAIKSADIVDGMLVIEMENIIPEEKKPRKIEIGNALLIE
jgi:molecular chaperone IbpA